MTSTWRAGCCAARPESVMRGLALGADGYVTKPFDHKTLAKGVKAVLGL